MKYLITRRNAFFAALSFPIFGGQSTNEALNDRVFEAVWEGVRDEFYDPNTRGVDWLGVKKEFRPRAQACTSREQLLSVLREMLNRLHNSHIFLYSREEWDLLQNVLPFCFDRSSGRIFVRYEFQSRTLATAKQFEFGDEILSVDGTDAHKLRPVTLAKLQEVVGNPNFGPADSIAEVQIRRRGQIAFVKARRVARPAGFESVVLEHLKPNIALLRMFTLGTKELPAQRLQQIWNQVRASDGLIIDLRNCVGGDSKVSNFIAGSLLGGGKQLFREVPRPGSAKSVSVDYSDPEVPRFSGKVAILTNSNTESQPEALAAICKEYGCARLIGERTAGALNGWTIAIGLPDRFARFALPYTRGISPKGFEYEGRGVDPDEKVINTIEDFRLHRDQIVIEALRYVTTKQD